MSKTTNTTLEPPVGTSELTERRYVYNGDTSPAASQANNFAPRGNRPIKHRKRSPFNIIVMIAAVSILIVFYVWNKIAVNKLAVDVNDLQTQFQKIESANDVLRADISKKSNLERIGRTATQIGLTYPKEQPVWIQVDAERLTSRVTE
jgi:cell division protein FtsL